MTIVVRDLERERDPLAVLEQGGESKLYRGSDISMAGYNAVGRAESEGTELISTVLLNTRGGYVKVGQPVSAAIGFMAYSGVPTWAFVDKRALSYGGYVLGLCSSRVVRDFSDVMFHQIHYRASGKYSERDRHGRKLPRLAAPREEFQKDLVNWLTWNCDSEHLAKALDRAETAFRDPDNHLDDVSFQGLELGRMGMVDEVVNGRGALKARYESVIRKPEDEWHPSVQRFFKKRQTY